MKIHKRKLHAILAAGFSAGAFAAVSPEEAKLLDGPTYTAWGAERAGNKEGTIPGYTGERVKPPADFDPKEPLVMPDPFKEKPIFSITAQNMDKYADKLIEGQKMMFKKYPTFRMDIYQTRRTVTHPKWLLEFTKRNATSCKTQKDGLEIAGCWGGVPFPFPKTGNEAMWNHALRWQMRSWFGINNASIVTQDGHVTWTGESRFDQVYKFHDPNRGTPAKPGDVSYQLRFDYLGPPRKVGEKFLFLFTLDSKARIWSYIPGQRRVKLAPDLAYDTPTPGNGGVVFMDQGQVFFGSQDRYDFRLVGKKEKYILYHNYSVQDYKGCPNEKLYTAKFLNPDCMRWELHRVWIVDAKLKPGFRHAMPHRVFYWDEDTWGAGSSDDYDAGGNLYKTASSFYMQMYNGPSGLGNYTDCSTVTDFLTGLYSPVCVMSGKGEGNIETEPKPDVYFSPEDIAAGGIR